MAQKYPGKDGIKYVRQWQCCNMLLFSFVYKVEFYLHCETWLESYEFGLFIFRSYFLSPAKQLHACKDFKGQIPSKQPLNKEAFECCKGKSFASFRCLNFLKNEGIHISMKSSAVDGVVRVARSVVLQFFPASRDPVPEVSKLWRYQTDSSPQSQWSNNFFHFYLSELRSLPPSQNWFNTSDLILYK